MTTMMSIEKETEKAILKSISVRRKADYREKLYSEVLLKI